MNYLKQNRESKIRVAQLLFDTGINLNKVSTIMKVERKSLSWMVIQGDLETYKPYEEYDIQEKNEVTNFEWLWEEDVLDDIAHQCLRGDYIINDSRDEDNIAVSNYCKRNYGSIVDYLSERHCTVLVDSLRKECFNCGEVKLVAEFMKGRSLYGLCHTCKLCEYARVYASVKRNPLKVRLRMNNRRTRVVALVSDLATEEWEINRKHFSYKCALCRSIDSLHLDHYIPVSWGHAGTSQENSIPLCKSCNSKKRANQLPPSPERDRIESFLASIIGCSSQTFRRYVDWCDANRRKPDAIKADKTSFELFTESEAELRRE